MLNMRYFLKGLQEETVFCKPGLSAMSVGCQELHTAYIPNRRLVKIEYCCTSITTLK